MTTMEKLRFDVINEYTIENNDEFYRTTSKISNIHKLRAYLETNYEHKNNTYTYFVTKNIVDCNTNKNIDIRAHNQFMKYLDDTLYDYQIFWPSSITVLNSDLNSLTEVAFYINNEKLLFVINIILLIKLFGTSVKDNKTTIYIPRKFIINNIKLVYTIPQCYKTNEFLSHNKMFNIDHIFGIPLELIRYDNILFKIKAWKNIKCQVVYEKTYLKYGFCNTFSQNILELASHNYIKCPPDAIYKHVNSELITIKLCIECFKNIILHNGHDYRKFISMALKLDIFKWIIAPDAVKNLIVEYVGDTYQLVLHEKTDNGMLDYYIVDKFKLYIDDVIQFSQRN